MRNKQEKREQDLLASERRSSSYELSHVFFFVSDAEHSFGVGQPRRDFPVATARQKQQIKKNNCEEKKGFSTAYQTILKVSRIVVNP